MRIQTISFLVPLLINFQMPSKMKYYSEFLQESEVKPKKILKTLWSFLGETGPWLVTATVRREREFDTETRRFKLKSESYEKDLGY